MHSILQALNVLLKRQAWGAVEEQVERPHSLGTYRLYELVSAQLDVEDLT